jgi:glutathione synthase/RimK-type ligase-like ATP-grasp enzyme
MSHPEITLVTASDLPAQQDTYMLVAALAEQGVQAAVVPWDEPRAWAEAPLVVLRTPWDYFHRLEEFLVWVGRVERRTRLLNPPAVVRWNCHKRYLLHLAERGVPILPTQLLSSGADLRFLAAEPGELVVKPAVGVSAIGAKRGRGDDPALVQHVEGLLAAGDVLVQPFAPDVAVQGEVSLIYVDGTFSHAVRKRPAAGDFRVQDDYGGTVHPYEPATPELDVAVAALAVTPEPTTYARVDLIQFEGRPAVMELEVIEPELFLRYAPGSPERLAHTLKRALRG